MKTFMPHKFRNGNLDADGVNDNLLAGADGVGSNMSRRYMWSPPVLFSLSGLTNGSALAERKFSIRRPDTDNASEIAFLEFFITGDASGDEWTLSCSDDRFADLSITTVADTEVRIASAIPIPLLSAIDDVVFTVSCGTASTIDFGGIAVHLRSDRGAQGADFDPYVPTLLDSSTADVVGSINSELASFASAVTRDANADEDLRCMIFVVRNLTGLSARDFNVPSGVMRFKSATGYVVAPGTATASFTGTQDSSVFFSDALNGAGATVIDSVDIPIDYTSSDSPMDPTADVVITLGNESLTTIPLAYLVVWLS